MATIIYDGECGLCQCTREALERLDVFHALEWVPFQDRAARQFGISRADMERSVWLVSGERRWSGFAAVKRILLRLPALYAAAGLAISKYPKSAVALGLFFSPLFRPLGESLYHWVSEHRHMVPGSVCGLSARAAR